METIVKKQQFAFNRINVFEAHIGIENAAIGITAKEGEVVSEILNNLRHKLSDKTASDTDRAEAIEIARKVLTKATEQNGTERTLTYYKPLAYTIKKNGHVETRHYEITSTEVTEKLKELSRINFEAIDAKYIGHILVDLSTLKNAESQIIIDGSKKFYTMESVVNMLSSTLDYSMTRPKLRVNWAKDADAVKRLNSDLQNHKKYASYGDDTLLSSVVMSTETTESNGRTLFSGPAHKVQMNFVDYAVDVVQKLVNQDYANVRFSSDIETYVQSVIKSYPETIRNSMYQMKSIFGLLTNMIISDESLKLSQYKMSLAADDDDQRAYLAAKKKLSEQKNYYYQLVRNMVKSAIGDEFRSPEDLGMMAMDVSYIPSRSQGKDRLASNWNIKESTFGKTIAGPEIMLAELDLVNSDNGYAAAEIKLAKGESIKPGDTITVANNQVAGLESTVKVADGEYVVREKNGKLYATKSIKEVFEANGHFDKPEASWLILPVQVPDECTAVEEKQDGMVVSVKYSDEAQSFYDKVSALVGSLAVSSNRKFNGNAIYSINGNVLEPVCEVKKLYDELQTYAHSKVIKVERVYRSFSKGKMSLCIFATIEGNFNSGDLPRYEDVKDNHVIESEEELDDVLIVTSELDELGNNIVINAKKEEVVAPEASFIENEIPSFDNNDPFNVSTELDDDLFEFEFVGRDDDDYEDEE